MGDSGAPVVDHTGAVVGFVFAGCPGMPMALDGHEELGPVYVSYIESAKMVFDRISSGFGEEVELAVVPNLESIANIVLEAEPIEPEDE